METCKILIADDEPIECVALELLLRTHFPFVTVLPGVHNGLDLIRAIREGEPHIAIVDINMPGLNGLDALEIVRRQYPSMKILIHSAYSEFDYARRAFALQATDYIVKPIQKPVFLETMQALFESLEKERRAQDSQQTISGLTCDVTWLMENDIMSSLLLGEIDARTERLFLKSLGREFAGGVILTVRPVGATQPSLEERFLAALRLTCTCFSRRWHDDLLLFLVPEADLSEENEARKILPLLKDAIPGYLFGVSTWKVAIEELPDALRESRSVLVGKKAPGVYFFEYQSGGGKVDVFGKARGEIAALFSGGKGEEAGRLASGQLLLAPASQEPLATLQMQAICLLLSLYESASTLPEVYAEPLITRSSKEFLSCGDVAALSRSLSEAIQALEKKLSPQGARTRDYVSQALLYIRRSYAENLSVEDVAGRIGISPFYLSRLLKQEYEETFVEILTRVRIVRALALLPDKSLSLQQIGELTGYPNTTYFYKVFKKQTGLTLGAARRYLADEG